MHQTDILVIGGGIAGTATACYLAHYGRQVILLEQSELAAEASGLNGGTLWATSWGHTPDLSSARASWAACTIPMEATRIQSRRSWPLLPSRNGMVPPFSRTTR